MFARVRNVNDKSTFRGGVPWWGVVYLGVVWLFVLSISFSFI